MNHVAYKAFSGPPQQVEESLPSLLGFFHILQKKNLLSKQQLDVAQKQQKDQQDKTLAEIFVDLNLVEMDSVLQALSDATGYPLTKLDAKTRDLDLIQRLPLSMARRYKAVVFKLLDQTLHVAMADPEDLLAQDEIAASFDFKYQIQPYYADWRHIQSTLDWYENISSYQNNSPLEDQEISTVLQNFVEEAVHEGASDIHFRPHPYLIQIMYRLDGLLHPRHTLHRKAWQGLCVRLKVMAQMDIAESRRPQQGRFSLTIEGREVDFRVASHPTVQGENIVLRILDKTRSLLSLEKLGFCPRSVRTLKSLAQQPQGMVILSGPTGSGKTTTLYSLLSYMDTDSRNIMTLEQPVEYFLPGIRQTNIQSDKLVSFSDGIRSILRQDPDVIFIAEIRDEETAQMALRAAMTGHLVLSTLHTNTSFSVPARLIDLGLMPALLSGHLLCAVAQRLVRKLCQMCRRPIPNETQDEPLYEPVGCSLCKNTGFSGRTALAEITAFTQDLDALVAQGASASEIKKKALEKGGKTLYDDAVDKIRIGETSSSEIERVLGHARLHL